MPGRSCGPQDATEMVDGLEQLGVDILFIIGGDGTLKGGAALVQEIARRGLRKSIVGIPKRLTTTFHTWTRVLGSKPRLPRR
jgi:6-phosphofructokinase 1